MAVDYSEAGIYGDMTYGCPFVSKSLKCAAHLSQFSFRDFSTILCIGAGNAYESVIFEQDGFHVTNLEFYHPKLKILKGKQVVGNAKELPFKDKEFDLVFCCETLEHVPVEIVDDILKESKRVSKEVFFTIATTMDPPFNTHINIQKPTWWYEKFVELGYKLKNFQYKPKLSLFRKNILITFMFPDGVLVHAKC